MVEWCSRVLVILTLTAGLAACESIEVPPGAAADADGSGGDTGDGQGSTDGTGSDASDGSGSDAILACGDDAACVRPGECLFGTCVEGTCSFVGAEAGCSIEGACVADGEAAELNACKVCDVATSPTGWTDRVCDDDDPCTDDTCDADQGCAFPPVEDGATCDDGVACTTDDHCEAGACVATACECEIDLDCEGLDHGACERLICTSGNECVATSDPTKNGEACDDGDLCLVDGTCQDGLCVGDTLACADPDPTDCVAPTCDSATGECLEQVAPDGADCSDGDPCTVADTCAAGGCGGEALDCSAFATACRSATCAEGVCAVDLLDGGCDDGNGCTEGDTCLGGACLGTWDTVSCACGEDADCDDGLACTQDTCDTLTGACSNTVLSGACLVDGQCWFEGQSGDGGPCQVCDPPASQHAWSPVVCDDDNGCTDDWCDPIEGCVAAADDTNTCDDGDPCTKDESCVDGACVGTCECKTDAHCEGFFDAVPACMAAECIGFSCKLVPDEGADGAACDDGDLCTVGDVCLEGACTAGDPVICEGASSGPCATSACDPSSGNCAASFADAGTSCADGDPCTQSDTCDGEGLCAGTPLDCGAFADDCSEGVCESGTCIKSPLEGSITCDDGDACTVGDVCAEGQCGGVYDGGLEGCSCEGDAECDDGLDCTVDSCSPDGQCVSTPKPGACRIDGACFAVGESNPDNACLVCDPALSKVTWQSLSCDDGDACTQDTCDPAQGCLAAPDDALSCDDGDPCSQDDHCVGGECVGTCACTVDADCAADPSLPPLAACTRWACQGYACVQVPDGSQDGSVCDDGLFCTVDDACQGGACVGGGSMDCSKLGDGVCVLGVCDDKIDECVQQPAEDLTQCSDGDPCTEEDVCTGGVCAGVGLDCSHLDAACAEGACDGGACVAAPLDGLACDDGQACTVEDVCSLAGQCAGTWNAELAGCGCDADADCEGEFSGDPCVTGKCDPATHQCYAEPAPGEACDDGNPCTQGDQCSSAGACGGSGYSCDDALSCTADLCDGQGGCDYALKDGACLIDGACYSQGQTQPGNVCLVCTGGETWTAADGKSCDDGVASTQGDVCAAGECSGTPYECDHDPACQTVAYDGKGGCKVTTSAGSCFIGGVCYGSGAPHPDNPCQSCQPGVSQSTWTNRSGTCDDGDPCTKDDLCGGGECGGTPYSCSDGLWCTKDACNVADAGCHHAVVAGACAVGGACYEEGQPKPGNPCELCDPAQPEVWSPEQQSVACNDGLSCTTEDHCNGEGQCVGSLAGCKALECEAPICNADGGCDVALKKGWCRIAGACYLDGDSHPETPCLGCDASASPDAWVPVAAACDDGQTCTAGDACVEGECSGEPYDCDDGLWCTKDACNGQGGCGHKLQAEVGCLIGGACYEDGQPNPGNPCEVCQVAVSPTTWTVLADGATCPDDGLTCTVDQCYKGQCVHRADTGTGECYIGGACHDNLANDPQNECQYCNLKASVTSWVPRSSKVACSDDGDACTTDHCSGQGTCQHDAVGDYTACNDGSSATTGDWCVSGACAGFTRVHHDAAAQGTYEAYIKGASTSSSSGVHVIHQAGKGVGARWLDGTTLPASTQGLGTALSPPEPGLSGTFLVDGDTLYAWSSGDWTTSHTAVTGWNKVQTNPGAVFWETEHGSHCTGFCLGALFFGAGRDANNANAVVRACSWGGTFPVTYACGDESVQYATKEHPVSFANLPGQPYLGSNYGSTTAPSYIDILKRSADTKAWTLATSLGVGGDGRYLRDFEEAGSYGVGVGEDGLFFAFDGSKITTLSFPDLASQSSTSFRAIRVDDGRVFVLGQRQTSSFTGAVRTFFLVHAPTTADLRQVSSWSVHTVGSVGGLAMSGSCVAERFSDHDMRDVESSATHMYLLGSWCSGSQFLNNLEQDAAFWYWPKP